MGRDIIAKISYTYCRALSDYEREKQEKAKEQNKGG